jgi:hypothetical protein
LCFFSLFFLSFFFLLVLLLLYRPRNSTRLLTAYTRRWLGDEGGSAWRRLREEERRSGEEEERRRWCDDESGRPGRKVCKENLRSTYAEVYIPFSYATATFSFSSARILWVDFIVEDFFHLCFTYLGDFYQLVRVINWSFSTDRKQFFSSFFSFFFKSDNQPSQDLAKSDYKTNLRSKKSIYLITCWWTTKTIS